MNNNNRKRSVAEQKAIKRYYAEKTTKERSSDKSESPLIIVPIKDHYDSHGGHPHIIVDDIDDKHVSVGITHDKKKGKNSTNYAMERNPFGGNKQSYMRRQGTVAPKSEYGAKVRKGEVTPNDFAKAEEYGGKAKQKYIEKHKKR